MGLYIDTSFDSAPVARRLVHRGAITDGGRRVTWPEFVRACAEARAKGWQVFPHEGCTHVGPDGYCTDRSECEKGQGR